MVCLIYQELEVTNSSKKDMYLYIIRLTSLYSGYHVPLVAQCLMSEVIRYNKVFCLSWVSYVKIKGETGLVSRQSEG